LTWDDADATVDVDLATGKQKEKRVMEIKHTSVSRVWDIFVCVFLYSLPGTVFLLSPSPAIYDPTDYGA
ncbi:hypothetical protein FIBSPDRAFT_849087, partial [Athelia psychrophila]